MSKSDVIKKINDLSETFVNKVTDAINEALKKSGMDHYEIVWKQFQTIAAEEIRKILEKNFPGCELTIPKSKSTYPDIKMSFEENLYAVDIKCNEMQKNCWFDMARIDTIMEKRIKVYAEEWELVIKYDSESKKFLKAYFNLFRDVVGIRKECNGIKYRPYSGHVRPKDWNDFETNKTYWPTKEKFIEGILKSQKHRWKVLIRDTLLKILDEDEKKEFKKLFD